MVVDNIFVTLADFIKQDMLGGSVIGYTLFALFLVGILFLILLTLRVPPKMGLLVISPALIGIFMGIGNSYLVNLKWVGVVLLVFIFIIMAFMAMRFFGGER